ncbi:poly(3-hydroxybutyrate) depolymerase, partial [Streptomyces sp. NPDC059556]
MRSPRPTRRRGPRRFAALLLSVAATLFPTASPAGAAAPPPVPGTLQGYDIGTVFSAGVSCGGFMATELLVAI